MVFPESKILIVGAGVFGTSTAYHLLKRGFTDVTVIDRSDVLPAKDAASNDFNRIVRSSYNDPVYSKLAKEAIDSWRNDIEIWGDSYHQSGVLLVQSKGEGNYLQQAYQNDVDQGARVLKLGTDGAVGSTLKEMVGSEAELNIDCGGLVGYLNYDNGWADAGKATAAMISKVKALGGKVIEGKPVSKLIRKDGATTGVECVDGSSFSADLVVLATGSWTPSTFPDLGLEVKCVATGQCVAIIQLTQEEAGAYRDLPVTLNFETGFYSFPPTAEGILKMAFHRAGFTHVVEGISTPRTVTSHPENGLSIPKGVVKEFRENLRQVYPDLAQKPFTSTRLCWYNDTPDGNWLIGKHPRDPGLVLATGGSGHAFKFLPVLGRIVADAIQGTLDSQLADKFALDRPITHGDLSRQGMEVRELVLDQLTVPEDLKAIAFSKL
ncbi:FAD dependent oxidoreductase [Marasmius fiardii PR-910]|nr:FAD dependent oxidoreductase [Marasmius fiardii PR-910]